MRICLELSFKLAIAKAVSRLFSTSCTAFLFLAIHRRQSRTICAFVVSRAQSFGADQPDPGRPILGPCGSLDRCLELLRLHLCPLRIPRGLCQPSDHFEPFAVARARARWTVPLPSPLEIPNPWPSTAPPAFAALPCTRQIAKDTCVQLPTEYAFSSCALVSTPSPLATCQFSR